MLAHSNKTDLIDSIIEDLISKESSQPILDARKFNFSDAYKAFKVVDQGKPDKMYGGKILINVKKLIDIITAPLGRRTDSDVQSRPVEVLLQNLKKRK